MTVDALYRAANHSPDAPAILAGDRTITYAELDRAASGVADLVLSSGALGASAVAFWGERTPEAVAAAWGIPRAGVDAVPIDPRTAPAAAMAATRRAGVRGLWTAPEGGFGALTARSPAAASGLGGYVVFTSGSEGRPKGVVITPENVAASVAASRSRLGHGDLADPWLCVLPLHHIGGLAILWRQADAAAPVLLHHRFDPDAVARSLRVSSFASFVPVMLSRVLEHATDEFDGPVVLVGGAAAGKSLLERARAHGLRALPTYGMTETTSQIATPGPDEPLDGTVGRALDGAEIRVVVDGVPVVGGEGRIEVRGPMVSPGYASEPKRDPQAWHVTGDRGSLSAEGRLTVLGRADAVIVTGGENVDPTAVETALREQTGIHAIRVRGEADEEWGMIVVADVVGDLPVEELDLAARRLPPAMRPRRWNLVERLESKLED